MNGPCFVTGQRVTDLIELEFNDTSALVRVILCHLPEKGRREIGYSIGDEREGQERKENE